MKHLKPLLMLFILCASLILAPLNAFAAASSSSSSTSSASSSTTNTTAGGEDSVQRIKEKGTLVVGTSADYPPYEFTTKKNGKTEYVGFEMDVARQFAKDLGVKLVIKNMDFDSLLVALESHKVDTVIAGMNITP